MSKDSRIIERKSCKNFDVVIIEHNGGKSYTVHTAQGDQIDLTTAEYDTLAKARKRANLYS